MDQDTFERVSRHLVGGFSRRGLAGLAGLGVASWVGLPDDVGARKKKKKKKKPPTSSACTPACSGKSCGPDGCGGICGSCGAGARCTSQGQCVCTGSCNGKTCGDDGCGNTCGSCTGSDVCQSGTCVDPNVYHHVRSFGRGEVVPGVAIDHDRNVYMDRGGSERKVRKYSPTGELLADWPMQGPGDAGPLLPGWLTFSPITNLLYATAGSGGSEQVMAFTLAGTFSLRFGRSGANPGEFSGIGGIAVNSSGIIHVVDDFHAVQTFNSGGTFQSSFGRDTGVMATSAIAIDGDDNVYVTDPASYCVHKFRANGALLTRFGSQGFGPGEFRSPNGIAVADDGVFVVDTLTNRVQKFTRDGVYVTTFPSGYLEGPSGIAVDADGVVSVISSGVDGVVQFARTGGAPRVARAAGVGFAERERHHGGRGETHHRQGRRHSRA